MVKRRYYFDIFAKLISTNIFPVSSAAFQKNAAKYMLNSRHVVLA